MARIWLLYVSFPLKLSSLLKDTRAAEKVVGKACSGAGGGFGMRDLDFEFATREERDAAKARALAAGYEVNGAAATKEPK